MNTSDEHIDRTSGQADVRISGQADVRTSGQADVRASGQADADITTLRADAVVAANAAEPVAAKSDAVEAGLNAPGSPEPEAVFASDQVGLGVDIVEISRMRDIIARTPSFVEKTFSPAEIEYCSGKANPETHFATRFAAKEAVVKALGTGFDDGIWTRDIEVRRSSKGRPYVVLTGRAREVARERGVREIPISLSYTHSEAIACAMAITDDAVNAAKKRVDPMEELAKQFKNARAMLDELPVTGAPQNSPDELSAAGAPQELPENGAQSEGAASAGSFEFAELVE